MILTCRHGRRLWPVVAALVLALLLTSTVSSAPAPRRQSMLHDVPSLSRAPGDSEVGLGGWKSTGCMAHFDINRTEFEEKCIVNVCYLFLLEAPYIILDSTMTSVAEQILFPCGSPPYRFRRLRGAAFDIMALTPARNATCAWAGPFCSFNHLVDFVRHQGISNSSLRFAITGLLLESPQRHGEHIKPGISLKQEELVIIGEQRAAKEHLFPVRRLVRPFQACAWGLFAALAVVYVLFAVAMAVVFGPRKVSWQNLVEFFIGDYSEADIADTIVPPHTLAEPKPGVSAGTILAGALTKLTSFRRTETVEESDSSGNIEPQSDVEDLDEERLSAYVSRVENRLENYRVARRLLQFSIAGTVLVFLIFYEIPVVNFVFIERSKPFEKSMDKLSDERLQSYSVQKNAATERLFSDTVDPNRERPWRNESTYPWKRCVTEVECFQWLLNDTHPVKMFVGFKTIGTYELVARDACPKFTIFNTEKRLYRLGAGWLYGSAVPEDYRHGMDRAIMNLQISETFQKILADSIGKLDSAKCNPRVNDIGAGILGVSVFFVVAPFLLLSLLLLLWHRVKKSCANIGIRSSGTGMRMSHKDIRLFCRERLQGRNQTMHQPRLKGR